MFKPCVGCDPFLLQMKYPTGGTAPTVCQAAPLPSVPSKSKADSETGPVGSLAVSSPFLCLVVHPDTDCHVNTHIGQ